MYKDRTFGYSALERAIARGMEAIFKFEGLVRKFQNSTTAFAQAFVPPSTVRFAPVMYDASGLATNATSAATSSTVP